MNEQKQTRMTRAKFEAYLGNYLNYWSYLGTYQNAFNALVEDVERTDLHVDRIAYPMLFIARHCLELGFKANIRYFKTYSEKTDFTTSDSHNLKDLFGGFKLHIRATVKNLKDKHDIDVDQDDLKDFENYCKEVETLTNQFDIIDNGSFSFRYPVDKNNNNVFKHDDRINLLDVKEVLDKAMILLHHTSDLFSKYIDYAKMIEETYEAEMRSAYGDYY